MPAEDRTGQQLQLYQMFQLSETAENMNPLQTEAASAPSGAACSCSRISHQTVSKGSTASCAAAGRRSSKTASQGSKDRAKGREHQRLVMGPAQRQEAASALCYMHTKAKQPSEVGHVATQDTTLLRWSSTASKRPISAKTSSSEVL